MNDLPGPEATRVRAMFRAIAGRYDRANTVLSAGIHRLWKRRLVRMSAVNRGDRVLDCATGTGDLAFLFADAVGPAGEVVGTDFCDEMLEVAKRKKVPPNVRFEIADVTALSYPDRSFDVASISFGIRNVEGPLGGIAEMARVVRPGGRVMVLEFGQPQNRLWSAIYQWYSRVVLPRLGGIVSGERGAYDYLQESSSRFPCGEGFVTMMRRAADFETIEWTGLTGGIAYLYRAVKR